jgi:hypothetical protein
MLAFCTPVYVMGAGALLLFSPAFGLWHLPLFFQPHAYQPLLDRPRDWLRSLSAATPRLRPTRRSPRC